MSGQNSSDADRLKIAIQKSGRLTKFCLDLLSRCGLSYTQSKDQLFCYGQNMPIDILLVRDDDIPSLVAEDICDLGVAGLNVIEEKRFSGGLNGSIAPIDKIRALDFGHCRLSIARPVNSHYESPRSLDGKRIATSYPGLLNNFLQRHSVKAETVHFSGAVEIAPRIGRADFICDLVSTGSTLEANQLVECEPILQSEAWIIQTKSKISETKQNLINRLLVRIEGVQQVKESKYIMLHAPRAALSEITRLLPGSESPTVLPLEGRTDLVAVHAVCRENVFWETLENLKEAGASSMLVLPVEKMLA